MENKIIKNLIILGVIIFSFALTNGVSAYATYAFSNDPVIYHYNPYNYNQGYSQYDYYLQYGYVPVYQYNNSYYNPYNYNQGYPQYSYYQQSGYVPDNNSNIEPKTSIVNNYYQTVPATIAKTSATTTAKTTTDTSNTSTNNTNGLTALSLRGSGGFMPSSIWQWIFVIILILVIIIISRIFIRKQTVVQESHTSHAH
ncbi:MAG: hypothetical protein WC599_14270 [Bacteroidales bacterium]